MSLGKLQLKLLKNMGTGTYDKKGLVRVSQVDHCPRVLRLLVDSGHILALPYFCSQSSTTLYSRSELGTGAAHRHGQLIERDGTYEAMVAFETAADYDNFLVIMDTAAHDGHLASPFNIQRSGRCDV